eukprot:TRINITY_DN41935_c0_g1_i1.p1 TRINITY_DN41935_c0_g1~~TRINITY_DN41935_c0_g1_i1.p1  ORF type:complete len:643 (+),score=161.76 TRINITY_DN41935_c0_g1_i1:239-2167(+)
MVQSLSPAETSKWCASLAPCGIRGPLLAEVQGAIVSSGIDGKQFDDLLKANTLVDRLQRAGVTGLTPRLSVAIRRTWNADFGQVRFIPCHEGGRPPVNGARDVPVALKESARRRPSAERQTKDFYDESLDSLVPARGPAPTSYAPPQPHQGRPPRSPEGPPGVSGDGGLDSMLPPKAPAPNSCQPPQPQQRARSREGRHSQAEVPGLGDMMPARGPAPTSYTPPSASQSGGRPPRYTDGRPPPSPDSVTQQSTPAGSEAPPWEADGNSGQQVPQQRRRLATPPPADQYTPAPRNSRRSRPNAGDWEGISLGGPPISKQQVTGAARYGGGGDSAQAATPSGQTPTRRNAAQSGWEGASLGEALGSRQQARNGYSPQENAAWQAQGGGGPKRTAAQRHAELWGGTGGLGEAAARTAAAEQTQLRPGSGQQEAHSMDQTQLQSENRTSPKVADDPWAGVALGGAPKQKAAPAAASGADPWAGGPLGGQPKATKADDPWAGISLGGAPSSGGGAAAAAAPKAAAAPIDWASEPRGKRRGGGGGAAAGSCDKSAAEIITWLRTLPESHVPEAARECVVEAVEAGGMNGDAFSSYVKTVPPEVCGPKPAMKLKAAWANVLKEAEARNICKQNLDYNAQAGQKGVALSC